MSWINRLFSKKDDISEGHKTVASEARNIADVFDGLDGIRFGRYSDNNKSYLKTLNWYTAEDLFKEKKYAESLLAFFEYLRDEEEDNVNFKQDGAHFTFD